MGYFSDRLHFIKIEPAFIKIDHKENEKPSHKLKDDVITYITEKKICILDIQSPGNKTERQTTKLKKKRCSKHEHFAK